MVPFIEMEIFWEGKQILVCCRVASAGHSQVVSVFDRFLMRAALSHVSACSSHQSRQDKQCQTQRFFRIRASSLFGTLHMKRLAMICSRPSVSITSQACVQTTRHTRLHMESLTIKQCMNSWASAVIIGFTKNCCHAQLGKAKCQYDGHVDTPQHAELLAKLVSHHAPRVDQS